MPGACERLRRPVSAGSVWGIALVAALAAAFCVSACCSSSPTASSIPVCRPVQLAVRTRHSFAGLGTAGAYLAFTNRSDRRCRLTGWPRIVGVTAVGTVVRARNSPPGAFPDVTARGAPRVVLRPGQRADAVFEGADGPGVHPCGPSLRWLLVTPPGGRRAVRLSAWIWYLGRDMPTCSTIRVSPVLPAIDLYRG